MARSIYPCTIVEKTPNHRPVVPSYTAWTLREYKADGSTPPSTENRPRYTLQIYDTTPAAASDAHVKWLCQYIHEATENYRDGTGQQEPDRIEVHGMPAEDENETEETRAQRCADHQKTEIASRNATGLADFYINRRHSGQFRRRIIIIDKPLNDLEGRGEGAYPQDHHRGPLAGPLPNPGPQGGFYFAGWDLNPGYADWYRRVTRDDPETDSELRDELTVERAAGTLSSALFVLRSDIGPFYHSYVLGGRLDDELRQARALADVSQYAHDSQKWATE